MAVPVLVFFPGLCLHLSLAMFTQTSAATIGKYPRMTLSSLKTSRSWPFHLRPLQSFVGVPYLSTGLHFTVSPFLCPALDTGDRLLLSSWPQDRVLSAISFSVLHLSPVDITLRAVAGSSPISLSFTVLSSPEFSSMVPEPAGCFCPP